MLKFFLERSAEEAAYIIGVTQNVSSLEASTPVFLPYYRSLLNRLHIIQIVLYGRVTIKPLLIFTRCLDVCQCSFLVHVRNASASLLSLGWEGRFAKAKLVNKLYCIAI